jgi:epoxyqueuosine reductase
VALDDVSTSPHDERVRNKARALGFDAVGVARVKEGIEDDFARYEAFVAAGMHGAMGYLAENAEARRRLDTAHILPGASSVVCLARRYQRDPSAEARDPDTARALARYARGQDYHNVLRKKVRRLAAFLRTLGTAERPVLARPLCDDAPVLERAWAARAGLGFVGKNGLLIVPGQGSMVLLGEVVTTLELTPDLPMVERCGACTRCLDVCPTTAFTRPFVLDPRRCISYWTIEQHDAIPEEFREPLGEHLFGCDDCQTVCPFNASSRTRPSAETLPFEPLARWSALALSALLDLDGADWARLSEGSPVRRARRDGLARNAAIVLANRGEVSALPALVRARDTNASPVVREAAAWAVSRLQSVATAPNVVEIGPCGRR